MPPRLLWPLFALFVGFILGGTFVWSCLYQPIPYDQRQPAESGHQDERASKPSATSRTHEQQKEITDKGKWYNTFLEHPTEWLLVLFNLLLALYTARLYHATNGLVKAAAEQSHDMKASIAVSAAAAKAAQQSADAATQSAQAVLSIERPVLYIKGITPDYTSDHITAEYVIENLGRTPAILQESSIWLRAYDVLPDTPDYTTPRVWSDRVVFQKEEINDGSWAFLALEDRENYDARAGNIQLYFIGYLRYADVFGHRRITGFCYRIRRGGLIDTIEKAGLERYNYDRIDEP
jgi:hypothetical protein